MHIKSSINNETNNEFQLAFYNSLYPVRQTIVPLASKYIHQTTTALLTTYVLATLPATDKSQHFGLKADLKKK